MYDGPSGYLAAMLHKNIILVTTCTFTSIPSFSCSHPAKECKWGPICIILRNYTYSRCHNHPPLTLAITNKKYQGRKGNSSDWPSHFSSAPARLNKRSHELDIAWLVELWLTTNYLGEKHFVSVISITHKLMDVHRVELICQSVFKFLLSTWTNEYRSFFRCLSFFRHVLYLACYSLLLILVYLRITSPFTSICMSDVNEWERVGISFRHHLWTRIFLPYLVWLHSAKSV